MQVSTGNLFASTLAALEAGVDPGDLVELRATREQAEAISAAVRRTVSERDRSRARRQQQRTSRRKNR